MISKHVIVISTVLLLLIYPPYRFRSKDGDIMKRISMAMAGKLLIYWEFFTTMMT